MTHRIISDFTSLLRACCLILFFIAVISSCTKGNGDGYLGVRVAGVGLQGRKLLVAAQRKTPQGAMEGSLVRLSAQGLVDPSFAGTGLLSLSVGLETRILVLEDLSFILAGVNQECTGWEWYDCEIFLRRFDSEGNPDLNFGVGGVVSTQLGPNEDRYFDQEFAQLQPGGNVAVLGHRLDGDEPTFTIRSFDTSGKLDPHFGVDGSIELQDRPFNIGMTMTMTTLYAHFAILPDGRLRVGQRGPLPEYFGYLPTGAADLSFGAQGKLDVAVAGTGYQFTSSNLRVTPRGNLMISGVDLAGVFQVFQCSSNGLPDSSFGSEGWAISNHQGNFLDIWQNTTFQLDGSILLGGTSSVTYLEGERKTGRGAFYLIRFTPEGVQDSTFADNGKFSEGLTADKNESARGVIVFPDDSILGIVNLFKIGFPDDPIEIDSPETYPYNYLIGFFSKDGILTSTGMPR